MCGIVGAIAQRDVEDILIEGLKRLEYRGYDSAGIAIVNNNVINRVRTVGKVDILKEKLQKNHLVGGLGIAHTRWATHGVPSENNAHPHVSGDIAIVHNGIIENYQTLKEELVSKGYVFSSDTDTEVLAHLINEERKKFDNLFDAINSVKNKVKGSYGVVIIDSKDSSKMLAMRSGSPLVIGLGIGENFVASDYASLLPVTRKFIYLKEDDLAIVSRHEVSIYNNNTKVERDVKEYLYTEDGYDKGAFRHYMLKEIYEQPSSIRKTINESIVGNRISFDAFGQNSKEVLSKVESINIIACGTSYHAGLVSKYWLEELVSVQVNVEVASEYRYRKSVTPKNCLFLTLSQSGETADTLAALRLANEKDYLSTLAICNVPNSSLVRESKLVFLTNAGREIGVASTKAFTAQLTALLVLVCAIGVAKGCFSRDKEEEFVNKIREIPLIIERVLDKNDVIKELSKDFVNIKNCLFLGRGICYPIAMEGALKLKEISYIHAEAYAAGELKHGPLALVDSYMPVIVISPKNSLLEKLMSNIQEVRARGGVLYVFGANDLKNNEDDKFKLIDISNVDELISPIVNVIPLQLLAYHVAIIKGTDVDQPRNLAKSVTVE